jgi:erythronate-4-phosphate dehydrogenase
MKILIDENIPYATETFGRHGALKRFHGRQLVPQMLEGVDALITRSITRVDTSLMAQSQPAFVGSCTIGIDHLDTNYLDTCGIRWTAAPGCNAQSVVDYVLSSLAIIHEAKIPETVGIVGCGNVGGLLRHRLLEIGCKLKVYDPFLNNSDIPELTDCLSEVMACGLVCLHTPLTKKGQAEFPTEGMIDKAMLDQLPPDAILINAGRGGVVRETDLMAFLSERFDVNVVMDVWEGEPAINQQLMSRVRLATPHIAGYSMEGKVRGTWQVYRAFCEHFGFAVEPVELLPPIAQRLLPGNIASLLLQVYDPQADMYRMKAAFALAKNESKETGEWFDELRKNYPERREIASYQVEGEISPDLQKYGFVSNGKS